MSINHSLAIAALGTLVAGPVLAQDEVAAPTDPAVAETRGDTDIDVEQIPPDELIGARVYDANDKAIGEVASVLRTEDGAPARLVVDMGGFLGLAEKPISLGLDQLTVRRGANVAFSVYLDLTEEQLQALPAYDG